LFLSTLRPRARHETPRQTPSQTNINIFYPSIKLPYTGRSIPSFAGSSFKGLRDILASGGFSFTYNDFFITVLRFPFFLFQLCRAWLPHAVS
jgi:hypothetical protein